MTKTHIISIWGLLITSIILSVMAVCRSFERNVNMDYSGIIVGSLAIMVTILMGLNIFQIIDYEKKIQRVYKIENYIRAILHDGLADLYSDFYAEDKSFRKFKLLHNRLISISYRAKQEEFELCNHHIREIINEFEKVSIKINREQYYRIMKAIDEIGKTDKFKDWNKVRDICNTIVIKDHD